MSIDFIVENSNPEEINNSANQVENQQPFLTVGDRVFKTKEDAARHIEAAQNHIKTVESNYDQATTLAVKQDELLQKASKVEELMKAVAKRGESSGEGEVTTSLSKEELIADAVKAFDQLQSQRTAKQVEEDNWNKVTSALTTVYAEKTNEVVRKVAEENGLSLEDAAQMARRHPQVFLKMFDTKTKTTATVNSSSVNTYGMNTESANNNKTLKPIMKMSIKERAEYVRRRLSELQE